MFGRCIIKKIIIDKHTANLFHKEKLQRHVMSVVCPLTSFLYEELQKKFIQFFLH